MTAVLAWILGPIGRYVAGAGLVLLVIGGVYWSGRHAGGVAERERRTQQDERVRRVVDEQVRNVTVCYARGEPWEWDLATGQCYRLEKAP